MKHLENDRMENDTKTESSSRHQSSKSAKEKILAPRASRSSKLRDGEFDLKPEKPVEQSYADQHCEIVENKSDVQKQQSKKATEAEELVKYMSDLPSYLQSTGRGGNIQERALNFGVLDWKRLERWKHGQKKEFGGRNVHYSSSSQASSLTYGSSMKSGSSGCETSSHAQKKKSPSLDFYLNLSAKEGYSKVLNERSSGQDTASNNMKIDSKRDQSIGKQHQRSEHGKSNRNDLGSKVVLHNNTCPTSENAISNLKGHAPKAFANRKTKPLDGESKSRVEKFKESGIDVFGENCVNCLDTYEFLSIREYSKEKSPESCLSYGSLAFHDLRPTEINDNIFSDDFHFPFTLSSDIPHSCPFPCNSQSSEWQDIATQDTQTSSNVRHSYADSGEMPIIQAKDKHEGQQNQSGRPKELPAVEPCNQLGSIKAKSAAATAKDPSPSQHSTSSLNRTPRSSSFREASAAQQVKSAVTPATFSNSSNRDKTSASGRAKSSPLRRILDPLLKPKASNHLSSDNPLSGSQEDGGTHKHQLNEVLTSKTGARSSNGMSNSSVSPPVKRTLNFSTCMSDNTQEKHACLQLACKNGLPLFTFTCNDSDILAAMMRKVYISGKDDFEWVYTFFSLQVKKKGRWINQGSKSKWHGYASNVVGQMKVSCSQCQKFTGDGFNNHMMMREFVLFSAELKQADHDALDLMPSSELAAIIIKMPKVKASFGGDGRQSNVSQREPARCFPQGRDSCCLPENQSSSIVVVLPGGVHSQPATAGMPSTLIDRWTSGGSCDCGGWDEGCTLRVFSSQGQESDSLSSSHACHTSNEPLHVDLFIQGGAEEKKLVFSLASSKEGLFKVDFSASISLLQAFSICLAILHGGKPVNLFELLNIHETKNPQEVESTENDRIKAPRSYVPYPPHSPVGRV